MTLYVVNCMNSVNLFQMAYFAMARKGEVSRRAVCLKTRDADDADAGYPKADPRWDLGVPSARPFPVADQWSFMCFNCNCLIVDTTLDYYIYNYIYIHGVVLIHIVPYRSFEIWDHSLHLRAFLEGFGQSNRSAQQNKRFLRRNYPKMTLYCFSLVNYYRLSRFIVFCLIWNGYGSR
jgi:hypothetical protein